MLKIYGSPFCPDCVACKKNFDHYGIEYEFIDIGKSIKDMHEFITMRDTLPVFNHCKEIHDIGLPALVKEDGAVFLSWEKMLEEMGYKILPEEAKATSCSLDRKGC